MKIILGLDLGTNSIGWALVDKEDSNILGMGSRIIPMGAELSKFEQGQAQTKNANRRITRGARKLNKRYKQRRNKLIYLLQELSMLPAQIKLSESFSNPLKIDRTSILPIAKNQKQYSALDLLELRVKALTNEITPEEFGKIIYLFNQLRGYSGGGNEPEKEDDNEEEGQADEKKVNESYVVFGKIIKLSEAETITFKNKQVKKYKIAIETEDEILEGDTFLEILKVNESLELLVNIRRSKQGETIVFKLPNKTSWRKKMENLEKELTEAAKEKGREVYLSEYFLQILQENKWAKIRNNVILRSRYQSEFDAIWNEQIKYHRILRELNDEKLSEILHFIFPGTKETQIKYREVGLAKGLYHVLRNQIIYYQRELKDQSDLISNCRFEQGEKAVAKSHPTFQEYKIWEQINKLTINTKTEKGLNRKGEMRYAYEDRPVPAALKQWLYDELQVKKEIGFGVILNKLKKEYKLDDKVNFLNGLNAKAKLRGNDTKSVLKKALGEKLWIELDLDKTHRQVELWDILYNGKGNEYDLESDRTSKVLAFLKKYGTSILNHEEIATQISKIKFSRAYAALSLKAIEKILPLVRAGDKYFNHQLSEVLNEKIIRLLNEVVNDPFEKSIQEFIERNQEELLTKGGMMNAYATMLVYDKHTAKEYGEHERINSYKEIERLKPGELRNPLVEQLVSEALMIVKDVWKQYGRKPDEIRLELARDLKNNAERRAKIYKSNRDNQKANDEVKNLLIEIRQEITLANIEKYKLWLSQENLQEEYVKRYKDPSKSEIEKIKLWKEQGHVSPYTGQPIPLSELFDRERYDVDHIIPQSRYFDDSFTNKVICEKAINKDKSNKTAMEYFEAGSTIPAVMSKTNFIDYVNQHFQGLKRKNLLATKVPEDPIARQMKETQYISVRVKEELNRIVGNEHVKTTTGSITDYLRNQWGLTDKFKMILKERYEKVAPLIAEVEYEKNIEIKRKEHAKLGIPFNDMTLDKEQFIASFNQNYIQKKNNKLVINGWTKRIDHRHHAIDALIVACTEPKHIKQLNDLNKELQSFLDSKRKELLPNFEGTPTELLDEILNLEKAQQEIIFRQVKKFKEVEMPWKRFAEDAERMIQTIVVSQKPKDKLLIQENEKDGELQIKIRGQLHEGTLYGKSQGLEAYRIPLTKFAGKKFATEKTIEKIANTYLKKVIKDHLEEYEYKKEEAFSAEGILNLNKKLATKQNRKQESAPHTPISSIKVFYRDPAKLRMKKGQEEPQEVLQKLDRIKAYNQSLFVKTGDNYLFAVLEREGKRVFDLITFFDAANVLKEAFNKADKKTFNKDQVFKRYFEEKNNARLLFTLKQGDAVYLPVDGEELVIEPDSALYEDFWNGKVARSKNIHYVTKYSGNEIYFIRHNIADSILRGKEFGSQNAYQNISGISIKDHCIKLSINRLGVVKPI
jgi:CRISPR/Cas system Type II protein with McrA/HNH and RuvC-like nuclease domain